MYEVSVEVGFESAHNLRAYKGKCENLHGHNWLVEVFIAGEVLDDTGMLIDFTIVKQELNKILKRLDHKYLNDIEPFDKINPTSENIAKYVFEEMSKWVSKKYNPNYISKVSVYETEKSKATYTTGDL